MLVKISSRQFVTTLALMGLVGCASSPQPQPSPSAASPAATEETATNANLPTVVATHSVLCDLTRQIAGETVNLKCLIEAGTDPHVYQPTPEDGKAIETADLILCGGYNFEPRLIRLIEASSNPAPKVAVDEIAVPKPLMGEHDHGEEEEHGHAEEHAEEAHSHEGEAAEGELVPDPHVWHNAQNGVQMVEVINENLSKVFPSQATLYAENSQKITAELTQIDGWIKSQVATIPTSARKLVTTHDALGYYADAYNIPIEGALSGISTDERPTATRVKELVDNIKTAGVPTVFAEVIINPNLIETVAKEANVQVSQKELFADGLGEAGSGAETYQQMLIANTQAIVEGLGGKFTPFAAKSSSRFHHLGGNVVIDLDRALLRRAS